MQTNPNQRADKIQSQQQSRYENKNHVIYRRQTIPSQCYPIYALPCPISPSSYVHVAPRAIEPIAVYDKPNESVLTAQGIQQFEINAPISVDSKYSAYDDSAPLYTYEISDPAQLSDQAFWTNLFSQKFNTNQWNTGDQSIIVEVVDTDDVLNGDESILPVCPTTESYESLETTEPVEPHTLTTETPESTTESEITTTETTDSFSTIVTTEENTTQPPPKSKSAFETSVIEELKRINEKLDQTNCKTFGDVEYANDEDIGDCVNDDDDDVIKDENEPIFEPARGLDLERRNKIRRALAALLRTVHELQSSNDNEIIQMFRDNRAKHASNLF